MTIAEIVTSVKAAIDEVADNESGFASASSDIQSLEKVIRSKIGYALEFVAMQCNPSVLSDCGVAVKDEQLTNKGAYPVYKLTLPDDFIAPVSAKLDSWPYAPRVVSADSETGMMQGDEYARGTYDRPAVLLEGKTMTFYSMKADTDKPSVSYIQRPSVSASSDSTSDISIPNRAEGAFIYTLAWLTAVALGSSQTASQLKEIAADMTQPLT